MERKADMDPYRLKAKIGEHEFDATGDPEVVNAQFQAFKELVAMALAAPSAAKTTQTIEGAHIPSTATLFPPSGLPPRAEPSTVDTQLSRIMRVDDRIVSLTVRAKEIDDAVLLILYGHKMLRDTEAVGGFEVIGGLTATGQRVERADRVLDRAARNGFVIIIGERRSRRYRLTNVGLSKAREVAAELIATVA